MTQRIVFARHLEYELVTAVSECEHDRIFVLTDVHTSHHCLPLLRSFPVLKQARFIEIPADDTHKTLDSLAFVWQQLQAGNATRHSLLINVGGGMVTDLGGFAASTFKRGINFINIPTTLLAMVDASVGGKTGINFGGMKNEVGLFADAHFVLIDTAFLKTLSKENLLSGYAEMLKHALLQGTDMWAEHLNFTPAAPPLAQLQDMVRQSVGVKARIVEADHRERDLRKALNLGHTFGHAFESFSHRHTPVLHGYAVAFGLVCELYLSCTKVGFPTTKMRQTVRFINEHYGRFSFSCDDYDVLIDLMRHDKKNEGSAINCTLLADVGQPCINRVVSEDEIRAAFDFYREGE